VLLNDPIQVEAARSLANRVLNASKEVEDEGRILQLFRWAVQRAPEKAELETLKALLASQRAFYSAKPAEADKLLSVGVAPKAASVPAVEQAAWVACARVLLNLHETITRE
jgi:hypothetical protein